MQTFLMLLAEVQIFLLVATMWGLLKIGRTIMSQISDLTARQNVAFDRTDAALADIAADVALLASGATTPEDLAAVNANVVRSETQAAAAEALAAVTANPAPPPPPPAP